MTTSRPKSPPCQAAEAPDGYMGYAGRAELVAELNTLLEAERAGAQVGAMLVVQAAGTPFERLARAIQGDEARWCRVLIEGLQELGAAPSTRVGDFVEKTMVIEGLRERLAFLNRGQGWVVRRLDALIPRVRDDALHGLLTDMRRAHQENIAWVDTELMGT